MSSNAIVKVHVKKIRCAKRLTQAELARRAGISLRYLIDIENRGHNLSLETVDALASGLGVPPFVLLLSEESGQAAVHPIACVDDILKAIDELRNTVMACNAWTK